VSHADRELVRGLEGGEPFRVDLTGERRVERAMWPDPIHDGTFDDRLEVHYEWSDGTLREITASLPARGWRLRMSNGN
jgi:hypothetical protein